MEGVVLSQTHSHLEISGRYHIELKLILILPFATLCFCICLSFKFDISFCQFPAELVFGAGSQAALLFADDALAPKYLFIYLLKNLRSLGGRVPSYNLCRGWSKELAAFQLLTYIHSWNQTELNPLFPVWQRERMGERRRRRAHTKILKFSTRSSLY